MWCVSVGVVNHTQWDAARTSECLSRLDERTALQMLMASVVARGSSVPRTWIDALITIGRRSGPIGYDSFEATLANVMIEAVYRSTFDELHNPLATSWLTVAIVAIEPMNELVTTTLGTHTINELKDGRIVAIPPRTGPTKNNFIGPEPGSPSLATSTFFPAPWTVALPVPRPKCNGSVLLGWLNDTCSIVNVHHHFPDHFYTWKHTWLGLLVLWMRKHDGDEQRPPHTGLPDLCIVDILLGTNLWGHGPVTFDHVAMQRRLILMVIQLEETPATLARCARWLMSNNWWNAYTPRWLAMRCLSSLPDCVLCEQGMIGWIMTADNVTAALIKRLDRLRVSLWEESFVTELVSRAPPGTLRQILSKFIMRLSMPLIVDRRDARDTRVSPGASPWTDWTQPVA